MAKVKKSASYPWAPISLALALIGFVFVYLDMDFFWMGFLAASWYAMGRDDQMSAMGIRSIRFVPERAE